MPQQKELLRELAAAHNSGAPDRINDWFTEDFRLHEPGAAALPVGHEGASQMRARFKTLTQGRPFEQSIMAIYRLENGRIAEDWGISIRALWR